MNKRLKYLLVLTCLLTSSCYQVVRPIPIPSNTPTVISSVLPTILPTIEPTKSPEPIQYICGSYKIIVKYPYNLGTDIFYSVKEPIVEENVYSFIDCERDIETHVSGDVLIDKKDSN